MSSGSAARSGGPIIEVAKRNGLDLAIQARTEKTIGQVIADPSSPDLIAGVRVQPLTVWADDRGAFAELARLGRAGIAERMTSGAGRDVQVSYSTSYPGTIKALHYHCEQSDLWAPVAGMLQVCLYDLRRGSETFARINTLYVGKYRMWELLIPPGVGHGYKVLGSEAAQLVYLTDRVYDPADEGRIAYNDPAVNYDWDTQHK